jgi:hypothetical protein
MSIRVTRRLRAHKLELALLGLLAGLAALAVWAVVTGFGAAMIAERIPILALSSVSPSDVGKPAGPGSETTSGTTALTGGSTGTSSTSTSLSNVTATTGPSQSEAGAGRTVVTQRLRISGAGNGQDSGAGSPRSDQPGQRR